MSECSYGSSPGNSGRLQITGGGEWLDSSPPCRIFITSNDLLSIGLPLSCLRGTAPPACLPSVLFLLSSPGSLSSVSPVASPQPSRIRQTTGGTVRRPSQTRPWANRIRPPGTTSAPINLNLIHSQREILQEGLTTLC